MGRRKNGGTDEELGYGWIQGMAYERKGREREIDVWTN
jgi:hypothetical protein